MNPFLESARLFHNQIAVVSNTTAISYNDILQKALYIRNEYARYKGKAVSLRYVNLSQFLSALAAFDGFCQAIYLIPEGKHSPLPNDIVDWSIDVVVPTDSQAVTGQALEPEVTSWFVATSGTTATPKWISHHIDSLCKTVRQTDRMSELTWGLAYQPFRFAGLQVVLQAFLSGAKLVDVSSGEISERLLEMKDCGVNALSATPSLWRQFLFDQTVIGLPLRFVTLGGEIVDQPILNILARTFPNAEIRHIYASTEAGVGFIVSDGLAGFPVSWLGESKNGIKISIGDSQHLLIEVPPQSDVSASPISVDTMDKVRIEKERVFFLGRASGVINVGGNKVHPESVEQVIVQLSWVKQVRVYGVENSILGQLVAADVVCDIDKQNLAVKAEILSHCKSLLGRFQVPRIINMVDNIDVTDAGKVRR